MSEVQKVQRVLKIKYVHHVEDVKLIKVCNCRVKIRRLTFAINMPLTFENPVKIRQIVDPFIHFAA